MSGLVESARFWRSSGLFLRDWQFTLIIFRVLQCFGFTFFSWVFCFVGDDVYTGAVLSCWQRSGLSDSSSTTGWYWLSDISPYPPDGGLERMLRILDTITKHDTSMLCYCGQCDQCCHPPQDHCKSLCGCCGSQCGTIYSTHHSLLLRLPS